ncbi:hypothetical protein SAMN05444336_112105 [Albimonas donghaensis]|uniref:Uncharacterized protein n=1 Tax=Albimonas donghaensis TaxID=356660 RepID=A0A1H3FGR1_9RHOB|nr:hypothetical protein [Albimonas donghaensis]SDX90045.1 hypothetical protein SAMN05444336_112105 [Albimonas donghaensis]
MEDAEKDVPGRTRVREILIRPLEAKGLRRKRGVKAEDHAKTVERLVGRLAYMTPDGLRALAEVVHRLAGGRARDEWPSEQVVLRFADGIEKAPPASDRLLTSYMGSAAGRVAWGESPFLAAELANFLIRRRRPPLDADWPGIRVRAGNRRRELAAAGRRQGEGRDSEADRSELEAWRRAEPQVRALVFSKQEDRGDAAA